MKFSEKYQKNNMHQKTAERLSHAYISAFRAFTATRYRLEFSPEKYFYITKTLSFQLSSENYPAILGFA